MRTSLIGLLVSLVVASASAQGTADPALASRAFLESELTRLGNDPAAALIRARLENGDFQAGDRIFIRVEGDSILTDTVTVVEGLQLPIRGLGSIPLHGVLRSELKDT